MIVFKYIEPFLLIPKSIEKQMFCKSFVLLYYCILKSMLNDNLNLLHQSEFTNILRNHRALSERIQLRKTLYEFYQLKILRTCFVALTHIVYNEVYIHQLFSISINFTLFCYWHRRKSSRIFLRKNCSKRLSENFQELIPSENNFHETKTRLHRECFLQFSKMFLPALRITYG